VEVWWTPNLRRLRLGEEKKERKKKKQDKTRMWANAQRDGALPNIGGALCLTTQSLADAHY